MPERLGSAAAASAAAAAAAAFFAARKSVHGWQVSASLTLHVQPMPHSQSAQRQSSLAQTPRLIIPLNASFFATLGTGEVAATAAAAAI